MGKEDEPVGHWLTGK